MRAETTRAINYTNYTLLLFPFSCPLIYSAHFDVSHAIWAPGGPPPKILPACTAVGFRALRAPVLYTAVFIFHIGLLCSLVPLTRWAVVPGAMSMGDMVVFHVDGRRALAMA